MSIISNIFNTTGVDKMKIAIDNYKTAQSDFDPSIYIDTGSLKPNKWITINSNGDSLGHFTYKSPEYFKVRIPKNCTLEEKVDFLMDFVSGNLTDSRHDISEDIYKTIPKKYQKFFINTNATEVEQKAANVKEGLEII